MRLFVCLLLAAAAASGALAQQEPDPNFNPPIESPAWPAGAGPTVLLDGAHANFHTLEGRYQAFGRLLASDGFVVKPGGERFSGKSLAAARVLVIANALHPSNAEDWYLPNPSAFDEEEIRAVADWVRGGGALLLIADHMPMPGAAEALAAEFGVLFANGFAMKPDLEDGRFTYDREAGGLADHWIAKGRSPKERVTSVAAFTGSAFRLAGPGEPLLTLPARTVLLMPEEAWLFSKRTPRLRADGMLQGAVLRFGKGRVAVFGEAAMFTAQVGGPERAPMGMSEKGAEQNPQFLLNVMHWLVGLIEPA
ncbi:MAG: DUF4350 domain-containing protein [Candidatus Polarisedimenticolia bacterium]